MFRGVATQAEYQGCMDKGLCGEHLQDVHKNDQAVVKDEFSRKAFNFVRINILYPLLFKKSPKCEKIKRLMGKTPPIAKIFSSDLSEVGDIIFVMDSVVIFTMCQLSKICCVGALFHTKKSNSEDKHIKSIQNLLLAERFENADIRYLYPVLQKNFADCDLDIIRATHCITLLFIRKFCNKSNIKIAIESIKTEMNSKDNYIEAPEVKIKGSLYSKDFYTELAHHYLDSKAFVASVLFSHLAVSIDPSSEMGRHLFVQSIFNLKKENKVTGMMPNVNQVLSKISSGVLAKSNHLTHDAKIPFMKEKVNTASVDLVDSDSAGSDSEALNEDTSKAQVEDLNIKNENNEKKRKDSVKSKSSGLTKQTSVEEENISISELIERGKKSPELLERGEKSPELIKKEKKSPESMEREKKSPELIERGKKSPTPPILPNKEKDLPKKKRTISDGSVSSLVEAEMDSAKISSYLKEASEALLVDCGYKAVQIFRGQLRSFIESLDSSQESLSFEEGDIVCIKYSYGIAYCKSGGCDDLQKSITIFKDIIENHDSITFPAAYYSVGLSYRKLNRFKEALTYLKNVENFLNKGIHFKVYPWPGTNTAIQETKPEIIKTLVEELIKECENPPIPDAYCRSEKCCLQPSIYYSDPDFKGYISLICSLQCHLQYHFQCWKAVKEQKGFTEKDFLEKPCFTPDCEGLIAKIQNIDKKGILSKEFLSDIKKSSKQKRNKCEKKAEVKEKDKKKKKNLKSEDHSTESLNENVKCTSRKNSVVDDPVQLLSESSSSTEETSSSKQPSIEKCQQNAKQEIAPFEEPSKAVTKSYCEESLQENFESASNTEYIKDFKLKLLDEDKPKSESYFIQSIKENIYSYIENFLQRHGPLKIEDPVLLHEISSLPDEACEIISSAGGIGEFLKDDLRFAYVGDCYVCIVSDLGTAYKMFSSLPTDFKSLQTLESEDNITYPNQNYKEDRLSNVTLNPEAVEYTPSSPFCNNRDSFKSSTHTSFSQNCQSNFSLPASFKSSSKSIDNCDTYGPSSSFSEPINKTKSFETVMNAESSKVFVPKNFLPVELKIKVEETEKVDESRCELKQTAMNSNPEIIDLTADEIIDVTGEETFDSQLKPEIPTTSNTTVGSSKKKLPPELKSNLKPLLKQYPSLKQFLMKGNKDEIKKILQNSDSGSKPFTIKESDKLVSLGTMTEVTMIGDHEKAHPSEDQNTITELKAEISKLSSKNSALQKMLKYVTEQQQKQREELSQTKKNLDEYIFKIESMEDDFDKKEQALLSEKRRLQELTKNLNESVQQQEKEIKSLSDDRNLLEIDVLSLKMDKEKMKNELDAQEKKFKPVIEALEKENVELKNKAKYAEVQVINMKKTEFLRRIEDRSVEAAERQKELNASTAMMGANFNPVLLNYVKILSSKLISYTNNLSIMKLDFLRAMDGYIKEIESGVSLKDLKIVEMKELPAVPSLKNSFPNNPLTDNSLLNVASSYNFKFVPPISPSSASPPISVSGPTLSTASPSELLQSNPPSKGLLPTPSPNSLLPTPSPNALLPTPTVNNLQAPVTPGASAISRPLIQPSSVSSNSSAFSFSGASKSDKNGGNDIDFSSLNPKIQESFKSGMASINSFASSQAVSARDGKFDTKNAGFNHVKPISTTEKDFAHTSIGHKNPEAAVVSAMAAKANGRPMPRPEVKASPFSSSEKLSYAGNLDTVPMIKPETIPSASESENKKASTTAKNSYPKLLSKLKDQFPSFSEEELMSLVGEFRSQRQGKLTGLPINSIIAGISVIINAKKKALEQAKLQTKSKTLVNKKLVPDTKPMPSVSEQPSVKKKTAWNVSKDPQRQFTGNADDDCTICYDPMDKNSAYKVPCGHFFHQDCIYQWLKNQSNCPVCRVLLLLPEEYPSLN